MVNITTKRFIDSIFKLKWDGFSIQNCWNSGKDDINAVFLDYNGGFSKGGEYVKIYCDEKLYSSPNLKIVIYLLNRRQRGKGDLLLKTFNDFEDYKNYVEKDLFNDVKELNDTKKEFYI